MLLRSFKNINNLLKIKPYLQHNLIQYFSKQQTNIHTFQTLNIEPKIKSFLTNKFQKLTDIQAQTFQPIIQGKDLIGVAQTGSGKTLAFGVPAILHIIQKKKSVRTSRNPFVLIISPTRQLALQIQQSILQVAKIVGIRINSIYGGSPKMNQIRNLKIGTDILVATPGRLLDFLQGDLFNLSQVQYLVLDEADRLLDIGFYDALMDILKKLPQKRQTILFSATFDKQIKSLALNYTNNPVSVQIGDSNLTFNQDIQQIFIESKNSEMQTLLKLLKNNLDKKILIFTNTKYQTSRIQQQLIRQKIQSTVLNGDLNQNSRQYNLGLFKSNKKNIMIATDVASRGLDINDINIIINYQAPQRIQDYIHRIGRTARAGKKGQSITFLNENVNQKYIKNLYQLFLKSKQQIPELIKQYNNNSNFSYQKKRENSRNNRTSNFYDKQNFNSNSNKFYGRNEDNFRKNSFSKSRQTRQRYDQNYEEY